MKLTLGLFVSLATVIGCLAQQEQQQQQSQSDAQARPSAPLLGVRYSAATDVSHVSFNSPLVSYGSSLNEIQLPAAPIQPANLKQAAQGETRATEGNNQESQQGQTSVRSFAGPAPTRQQPQASTATNQPQLLSVQQYPANPQQQSTPQGFSLSQNLPGPQPQLAAAQTQPQIPQQQQFAFAQPQQQYVLPQPAQPQQYVAPQQQQYVSQQQQYLGQQQQQPYIAPQQLPYQAPVAYSSPGSNAYFATGPYAAQYPQTSLYVNQFAPQPVTTQYAAPAAPAAQFVTRVAFNGPASGFSYSF